MIILGKSRNYGGSFEDTCRLDCEDGEVSSASRRSARLPISQASWTCAEICLGVAFALAIVCSTGAISATWQNAAFYLTVPFLIFAAVAAPRVLLRRTASDSVQQKRVPSLSRNREAQWLLFGFGAFFGLASAAIAAIIGHAAVQQNLGDAINLPAAAISTVTGLVAGTVLTGLQNHLDRRLGFVPIGAAGLTAALAWAWVGPNLNLILLVLGFATGIVLFPLRSAYVTIASPDRCRTAAWPTAVACGSTTIFAVVLCGLVRWRFPGTPDQLLALAVASGSAAAIFSRFLFRHTVELLVEIILWPIYRIRAEGNGLEQFPLRGPVLVVANHSAWVDPCWLGKVLPRLITPMMTSVFYDLPIMRWLMVHVVRAIRVEASNYRREAPELQQAVAALDRGECVLIFPEGWMRRRADQMIRPFAQGPWHILRERPQTPVVLCWIEGGWGSFFSYFGGYPTKNKRFDWWRRIRISVEEPRIVDPAILNDLGTTRNYLMRACLHARRHLGLEVPPISQAELDEACALPEEETLAESA